MNLYTTLKRRGFTEKEASHISCQLANRYGEKFLDFSPVWVMHEFDEELVRELKREGKWVYWFEVEEEKYFDGNIRTPYCILMYDLDNLRGTA